MVGIPGGEYWLGSEESEEGRRDNEGPVYRVTVPAFDLCRHPVTNEEYARFLAANPDAREPKYWADGRYNQPRQPVVGVAWDEADAFCTWAGLRLPSEAEWEYACRAGTRSRYWSGDGEEDLARVGWYDANSHGRLHPVGELLANEFGLLDMHGNVWEWCADTWHNTYEGAPSDGAAWIDERTADTRKRLMRNSRGRVVRGGCWINSAEIARSAIRGRSHPGSRSSDLGFRPARSVTL